MFRTDNHEPSSQGVEAGTRRSTRAKYSLAPRMRFSFIRLENWRNFSQVGVPVQERNFLVGPNASGKSNFLDALRFLNDLVSIRGGFESAVTERGGVSAIRCLAARKNPNVAIDVRLQDDVAGEWRYRLSFGQGKKQRPEVREEKIYLGDRLLLQRPNELDATDPIRLEQTHLEQVTANVDFRPVADFFRSIRYFHIVPQLVRESYRWEGPETDPYGGDFLERILETNARSRKAWLGRIEKALTVAVPQLQQLEAIRDDRGAPHLQGKYAHWRPQGAWQQESQFSDGTLRLLGLLWALLDGSGPLLLEEPELSLHPEVVRQIPQLMARVQGKTKRQIFVSTHSSDLLRDRGIAPDEVFLFTPSASGTKVEPGVELPEVRRLLESGLSLAEIIVPLTSPQNADQLSFFPD